MSKGHVANYNGAWETAGGIAMILFIIGWLWWVFYSAFEYSAPREKTRHDLFEYIKNDRADFNDKANCIADGLGYKRWVFDPAFDIDKKWLVGSVYSAKDYENGVLVEEALIKYDVYDDNFELYQGSHPVKGNWEEAINILTAVAYWKTRDYKMQDTDNGCIVLIPRK